LPFPTLIGARSAAGRDINDIMAGGKRGIALRVDDDLFERIEQARGQTPRERWVREAVEMRLNGGQLRMPTPAPRNVGPRRPLREVQQRGEKK
jgi:hypothetical protein